MLVKPGDPLTINRLYGRSSGHKLRTGQAELIETLLPAISVPDEGEITANRLFGSASAAASTSRTAPTSSPTKASSAASRFSTASPPPSPTSVIGA
jgi:hypothetical protein